MRVPTADDLLARALEPAAAADAARRLAGFDADSPESLWSAARTRWLTPDVPFAVHHAVYEAVFADRPASAPPPPAWTPDPDAAAATNLAAACRRLGLADYDALWRWSVAHREDFWRDAVTTLGIRFEREPDAVLDLSAGVEDPRWLPGARLNVAASCLDGDPDADALVWKDERGPLRRMTRGELGQAVRRTAGAFRRFGVGPGDAVAIAMPMTAEAVVAYLGLVHAGSVVVSIADSFSAAEIATRARLAGARLVVTSDAIPRGGRVLPMAARAFEAGFERAVVVRLADGADVTLREGDVWWDDFLADAVPLEAPHAASPDDVTNVLFSSGTTGEPKAIPWTHLTPIKCAMDGCYHHDIRGGDVVAWPTNIGWMMGPWLIYAALVNGAAVALYHGAPNTPGFCRFVEEAGVTMLGVVPSLVRAWRAGGHADGVDWSRIRCFSSTGEASNPEDMLWLMSRVPGYRPVVEYCGGTEIGGGYITQTLVQAASPATFSTPALGLDFVILDDEGRPADVGELFLVPPSIGLSQRLIHRDHHEVYYAGCPRGPRGETLRRHGDQMERLPGGYYRALGRADDTMNLGGIKVSSAEIERAVADTPGIVETAAIAVPPPGGGPARLVICAVVSPGTRPDAAALRQTMQQAIRTRLNPLFHVHDVVVVDALPRTASNKVMRRVLRDRYRG